MTDDDNGSCPTLGVCPPCREGWGHWNGTQYVPTQESVVAQRPVRTPRTWPENAMPTAEEFAAWLGVLHPAERLLVARQALQAQEDAMRCFLQNHDRRLADLDKPPLRNQRRIVLCPGRLGGDPTVGDTRIGVDLVAGVHWQHGMGEAESQWEPYVTRDGVLAACWYVARYGTRTWRKRWAGWLEVADAALWSSDGWDGCPDPPSLADSDESQDQPHSSDGVVP